MLVLPGISVDRSRGPDRDAHAILAEIALPVMVKPGGELTALPVLETVATEGEFYDTAAQRDPALRTYHCPADLPAQITALLANAAITAHRALGCDGYSRSDFVLTPAGIAYWLEVNALPGLSRAGNLATMVAAAGFRYDELVTHILATAKRRCRYTP